MHVIVVHVIVVMSIGELDWGVAEKERIVIFFASFDISGVFTDDHQKSCINWSEDSTVHCRVVDRCDV